MYISTILLLLSALSGSLVVAGPVNLLEEPILAREIEARVAKTITYDCASTPGICLNTCWAQYCRGIPATLHGGGGADDAVKRAAWGYKTRFKKSKGWTVFKNGLNVSPEEYPYASAEEGGLRGTGQTLALRLVPIVEQKGELFYPHLTCLVSVLKAVSDKVVSRFTAQGGKLRGLKTSPTTDTWNTDIASFTNLAYL